MAGAPLGHWVSTMVPVAVSEPASSVDCTRRRNVSGGSVRLSAAVVTPTGTTRVDPAGYTTVCRTAV